MKRIFGDISAGLWVIFIAALCVLVIFTALKFMMRFVFA